MDDMPEPAFKKLKKSPDERPAVVTVREDLHLPVSGRSNQIQASLERLARDHKQLQNETPSGPSKEL